MNSNESPSPYGRRPFQSSGYGQPQYNQPRPPVNEDSVKTAEVQIERKFFVLTLKENPRGRFLRISEEVGGKRNSIIIPSTGLAEFQHIVAGMVKASEALPPRAESPKHHETPADDDSVGNR